MALTATFWDVQHGSATWLRMPNGENIVIDLGIGSIHGGQSTSARSVTSTTGGASTASMR